jgi:hypothetical protein
MLEICVPAPCFCWVFLHRISNIEHGTSAEVVRNRCDRHDKHRPAIGRCRVLSHQRSRIKIAGIVRATKLAVSLGHGSSLGHASLKPQRWGFNRQPRDPDEPSTTSTKRARQPDKTTEQESGRRADPRTTERERREPREPRKQINTKPGGKMTPSDHFPPAPITVDRHIFVSRVERNGQRDSTERFRST